MTKILLQIIIIAYACAGVVATIGYIPTIKDLWRHKKKSANISSYIIWTASSGISFLYASFILPNLLFRVVSGLSFVSCAIILAFSIALRNRK